MHLAISRSRRPSRSYFRKEGPGFAMVKLAGRRSSEVVGSVRRSSLSIYENQHHAGSGSSAEQMGRRERGREKARTPLQL